MCWFWLYMIAFQYGFFLLNSGGRMNWSCLMTGCATWPLKLFVRWPLAKMKTSYLSPKLRISMPLGKRGTPKSTMGACQMRHGTDLSPASQRSSSLRLRILASMCFSHLLQKMWAGQFDREVGRLGGICCTALYTFHSLSEEIGIVSGFCIFFFKSGQSLDFSVDVAGLCGMSSKQENGPSRTSLQRHSSGRLEVVKEWNKSLQLLVWGKKWM